MAWYNKYRPFTFAETIGQELVKKVLQNTVKTNYSDNPKIKHAYLFSGPRGTGKTSLARIFARSINCIDQSTVQNFGEACGQCDVCKNGQIDIIELDAASNTGIDNIRDLIEAANTPPFISKYKVYIIDEIHMLSKSAMNALLKTLEEPPFYLVFLLATTDPEKILTTILSRVTHLKLINHTVHDISEQLLKISKKEALDINLEGVKLISKVANGGLRDAVNLLETISHYNLGQYTEVEVAQILGVLPNQRLEQLSKILTDGDFKDLKPVIDDFESLGTDPEILLSQLLDFLLTQSLENYIDGNGLDLSKNDLIQALSQILSNKLSISSIQSVLVLLKIQLTKINSSENIGPKPATVKIDSNPPKLEIKSIEPATTESKLMPENITNQPNQSISSNTIQNFYSLIKDRLVQDTTAPMALKSYLNNIEIVEEEDTIYLYLANKSIILLLKSTKVTQWLKDLAQISNRGSKRILIITEENQEFEKIKDRIKSNTKTEPQDQTMNEVKEIKPPSATQNQNIENQIPQVEVKIDLEKNDEGFQVSDFYYLYAALPDGRIPKGMRLLAEKTQAQKNSPDELKSDSPNAWDDELDDLDLV